MFPASSKICIILFLLTPLREGRPAATGRKQRKSSYFYSRPCGRGDRRENRCQQRFADFYSRPCGRGDQATFTPVPFWLDFYSRPCGRGDAAPAHTVGGSVNISTHAPAGGATGNPERGHGAPAFLLTPLREGRLEIVMFCAKHCLFLLTPLREGRQDRGAILRHAGDFYSRPCGRGDPGRRRGGGRRDRISTHAPAGGATRSAMLESIKQGISTHAPAGGATDQRRLAVAFYVISTHAPAGGATMSIGYVAQEYDVISTHAPAGGATSITISTGGVTSFLLTPLREGRPGRRQFHEGGRRISTHAPAGGATPSCRSPWRR